SSVSIEKRGSVFKNSPTCSISYGFTWHHGSLSFFGSSWKSKMTSGPKWAASTSNISFGSMLDGDSVAQLEVLLAFDLLLDLEKPLEQSFGPRRAAGHVDVDGDDLVDALAHRVRVLEEASAVRAASHRDDVARFAHLVVE